MKNRTLIIAIIFSILFPSLLNGQIHLNGIVKNENDHSIKGAIVSIKNHTKGIRTDENGSFNLEIDSLKQSIVVEFPGYKMEEIIIQKKRKLNIKLTPEAQDNYTKHGVSNRMGTKIMSMPIQANHHGLKSVQNSITLYDEGIQHNTEDYSAIHEIGFRHTNSNPLSTFSLDVDNASYSNIRRFINMGQIPPKDAVRIEEMINYFNYNFKTTPKSEVVNITTEYAQCPWKKEHQLIMVGIQGKEIEKKVLPSSNLVFLIDVSGSMADMNKLPLVQSSLKMLVNELRDQDKVAIVVYAGAAKKVLSSTGASKKEIIIEAIEQLKAGGSTAGGDGLKLAYQIASQNFIEGGNNRIILATDGDFNVGQSSDAEMERLVAQQRDNNIYLTVLGYGMGNYKDNKLEAMADNGNGNYAYIDNFLEAKKVLLNEFAGTLFTIANDVKLQLEFNPKYVQSFRLIGYENRALKNEDFNNDKKDAGELGAGHQLIALYEIIPTNIKSDQHDIDPLKYQQLIRKEDTNYNNEVLTVKFRYKIPTETSSLLKEISIKKEEYKHTNLSADLKLAAAIAQFGMLLRNAEFKGQSDFMNTLELLSELKEDNLNGHFLNELIELIEATRSLSTQINIDSSKL